MKHYNQTQVGTSNAVAIILLIITLCFIMFSCNSEERFSEVWVVNGDIEFTYQGDHFFVETEDEQEVYHFNSKGRELTFRHLRAHCNWSVDSIYSCKNYIVFNDQIYLAEEGL